MSFPIFLLRHAAPLAVLAFGAVPAHAIVINITTANSIQQAIDQVHAAGGGTVNLAAGTYVIGSTIVLHSNLTLSGAGTGKTIIRPPNAAWASEIISDGSHGSGPNLSNVTIQKMTLDGLGMSAYNSMGIQITPTTGVDTNLKFDYLEIKNCAQGCGGPGNCNGLIVTNCNFHHNGLPVQGKPGLYYDNMYFWNGSNIYISNSTFSDSPYGCGFKWGGRGGAGSTIQFCNFTNNHETGLTIQNGGGGVHSGITVYKNIVSGNLCAFYPKNDGGLSAEGTSMTFDGNTVTNNGGFGILTWTGSGVVKNNTSTGNPAGNYQIQGLPGAWTLTNNH